MKSYAAIILAAGYSSRMGDFKPLMDLGGKNSLQRCINLFKNAGINDIIVVTGYQNNRIEEMLTDDIRTVVNNKYNEGMFSSIKAGAKVLSKNTDAFFLLPVDIASVKVHTIEKMIGTYEKIQDGILFPTFNEEKGHPTLISCSLVEEILMKNPEGGLREILSEHKEQWYYEETADRGILLDMDTKEDVKVLYEHILKEPFPDYEECLEILRLCKVKQETIEHMISVSEFSKKIAILINEKGYNLNINAAFSGALLHDVAKGKKDHAEEGATIAQNFGYVCLSEIIGEHMELKTVSKIDEKKIVYICDKLLKGTQLVTLNKRFEESFCRYEHSEDILKNVNKRYEDAKVIKNNIENILGNSLENLR
ncbi:molybdopterin-guanine dinucleotide biosynthesis protein MobA [Clostridium gelidum]|uniref:Molybdopterin-guanine dinucleotide biosynthesis protein MobA n=1 Tax=Clostridium gelidum TaxID=704125 RepID=A0ABM7T3F3_9CLOT|nr:NTP transferase domain-containing protein [Clostridium gelidum]BCZ46477.1 molybdopterin-guanine dinucleotide biosynthesis protein MobA [Clostridium gelidum]